MNCTVHYIVVPASIYEFLLYSLVDVWHQHRKLDKTFQSFKPLPNLSHSFTLPTQFLYLAVVPQFWIPHILLINSFSQFDGIDVLWPWFLIPRLCDCLFSNIFLFDKKLIVFFISYDRLDEIVELYIFHSQDSLF